jgi:hypothetical protein
MQANAVLAGGRRPDRAEIEEVVARRIQLRSAAREDCALTGREAFIRDVEQIVLVAAGYRAGQRQLTAVGPRSNIVRGDLALQFRRILRHEGVATFVPPDRISVISASI